VSSSIGHMEDYRRIVDIVRRGPRDALSSQLLPRLRRRAPLCFLKLRAALHPGPAGKALILAFMTSWSGAGHHQAGREARPRCPGKALSYVGYSWMVSLSLLLGCFRDRSPEAPAVRGNSGVPGPGAPGVISPRTAFFIPLAMSAVTAFTASLRLPTSGPNG